MIEILLNICVINAQILYNIKHSVSELTVKQFRETLIDKTLNLRPTSRKLVQETKENNCNNASMSNTGNQKRSAPNRKLQETEEKCSRNRKLRKRCTECYKKISKAKGFR